MRDRRFLALGLTVVAALFSGVVIGVLVTTHLSEGGDLSLDSPMLQTLGALLQQNPDSGALKEAIRHEDLRVRQMYFTYRRRMRWGAYLLLAGLAAAVISAKWYVSLDPRVPMPSSPTERTDADRWLTMRRRSVAAVGVVGGLVAAMFLVMSIVGGGMFPRPGVRAGQTPQASASLQRRNDAAFKENWPRFRGPTGMGIAQAGDWPRKWDAKTGENILWQTPIPAPGKSSPAIWGNRIFLTGGDANKREVFCFERANGHLLWRRPVVSAAKRKQVSGGDDLAAPEDTGYAAPSPATDGRRVYVIFATADVAALDYDGNVVWTRNLGKPDNMYGMASSLLVYKNMLIVQLDRGTSAEDNLSAILALDTRSGKPVWRTPRLVPNSWSTPVVAQTKTRPELITSANPWVIAYDPGSGRELWRANGLSGDVASSPVFAGGMIFATNAYAQAMAIRSGGSGDVTKTHIVWTAEEGMPDAASPICDGNFFLQANSSGLVTCYDAHKGKLLWEHLFDPAFWASPTLAGTLVYLPGDDGKTYIFKLADTYRPVSTGSIGEAIHASPAFADGRIYIRGEKHLFCVGKVAAGN